MRFRLDDRSLFGREFQFPILGDELAPIAATHLSHDSDRDLARHSLLVRWPILEGRSKKGVSICDRFRCNSGNIHRPERAKLRR